jgi:hypothetical protein
MKLVLFLALIAGLAACDSVKEKSKEAINKAGEVAGKAGSEFADGMRKGVEKTFSNPVELSAGLQAKGLQTGKILIAGSDSTTDNIVSAYCIFSDNIDQPVTMKLFSDTGQEFGRVTVPLKGNKGEARYIDFVFDKRTNIDGKGKITME